MEYSDASRGYSARPVKRTHSTTVRCDAPVGGAFREIRTPPTALLRSALGSSAWLPPTGTASARPLRLRGTASVRVPGQGVMSADSLNRGGPRKPVRGAGAPEMLTAGHGSSWTCEHRVGVGVGYTYRLGRKAEHPEGPWQGQRQQVSRVGCTANPSTVSTFARGNLADQGNYQPRPPLYAHQARPNHPATARPSICNPSRNPLTVLTAGALTWRMAMVASCTGSRKYSVTT